jgi:hypothetical protein
MKTPRKLRKPFIALLLALFLASSLSSILRAQTYPQKIGELELLVGGLVASVSPTNPVIPKNIGAGVRIVVTTGGEELTADEVGELLGGPFTVEGTLSGPGLPQTVNVPGAGQGVTSDPLLLPLPALPKAGDYTLGNLRFIVDGEPVFDVTPEAVTVKVIDEVLVTSVLTRALTLSEIQEKGIVISGDDYLGFQFDIGLMLSSKVVNLSFPVVFSRQGGAVPETLRLPEIERLGVLHSGLPQIQPVLLIVDGGDLPRIPDEGGGRGEIHIPAILVIPGDVGYLKQFFSAQMYVANGTPTGSNLTVRDVTAKITLPPGDDTVTGTADDPLALPETSRGPQSDTLPVLAPGPDGNPSVSTLEPGATGVAEFLLRGEKEGYHALDFDIHAVLDGLVTGPVSVGAKTSGGVLVRNPYFDMTFIVPSIVRKDNEFNLYVSVHNISQAIANDVRVTLNSASLSGAVLLGEATQSIETLRPGESQMVKFPFRSLRTGKVVATYLRLDTEDGSTGRLQFTLGVDSRNAPLSPDTLSLPATVNSLPDNMIDAAMRVLGEAWGVANAPAGTLPPDVIRISKATVTQKALALAEAGLRQSLGQQPSDVLKDIAFDFWGGDTLDRGFDQLLRESDAGHDLAAILGMNLTGSAQDALEYQRQLSQTTVSGPDSILFAVAGDTPVSVTLSDRSGNAVASPTSGGTLPGGVIFPLGETVDSPLLGMATSFTNPPYTLDIAGTDSGTFDFAITVPRGDGRVVRAKATGVSVTHGWRLRVVVNPTNYGGLVLQSDTAGDGSFSATVPLEQEVIAPPGPELLSATVFGQETLDGAGQYGWNMALLFDRIVDKDTSAQAANISMPSNSIRSASRQLSGRMVFAVLEQPEGPYVPTTVKVEGIADLRGVVGSAGTVTLQSRLEVPGAVVSGRVTNADGTPSVNTVVSYVGMRPTVPFMSCPQLPENVTGLAAVATDGDGNYQFRFVRGGDCGNPYEIAVKDPANGVLHSMSNFVRHAGERLVYDFVFYGAGTVTGVVRDLSGRPVYGADVYAMSGTDGQMSGHAVSDGDGRYTIRGITVGSVTVRAVKGTGIGLAAGNIDQTGAEATVNVTLDGESVSVSGVVRKLEDSETMPVPGVPVVYFAGGTAVGAARTGEDGSYVLEGMPVGPYRVFTGLNTDDTTEVLGVAAANDRLQIDLTIVPTSYGTVEGVVRFPNGDPAADALVTIGATGALTSSDGAFSIPWVRVKPSVSQTVNARTLDGRRKGQTNVFVNTPGQVVGGLSIALSSLGSAQFTVLDAAGQPVAGQPVRIASEGDPCGQTSPPLTTNSEGRVTFDGLAPGVVQVKAVRQVFGFAEMASGTATVVQDGVTAFGVLRFNGVGTVSGMVLNPDGEPSHGALVDLIAKFYNPQNCSFNEGTAQQFTTGPNGNFLFKGVSVGSVGVRASHPFFPTKAGVNGTLRADGDALDFTIRLVDSMAGELSGTVFLPDGVTPAGAGIEVTADGPLPDVTVVTNEDGLFAFARILPAGRYTLTARDAVTGGVVQEVIELKAGQDFAKELRLLGTGTVRVEVVDGAGLPVESALIRLNETDFPKEGFDGVLSLEDEGVLDFHGVFEGNLNVVVSDGFGRGGRAAATLPPGTDSIDVRVQITTTGTVRGRFLHTDGSAIPNGVVSLIATGGLIGRTATPVSGEIGSFSFDYVPAGPISVSAQDPTTARTGYASGVLETEEQILTLDVTEGNIGTVEGVVTGNGELQPGVVVQVIAGTFKASATADSSGRYSVAGIPEGPVMVSSSLGDGFLKGTASGTLSGEGTVLTLDIALRAAGGVTGQVFESDGVTAAPASMVTIEVGGTGGGRVTAVTDGQGRFAFARVPAGVATVTAEKLGGVDRGKISVTVPENDSVAVNVTLNGTGAIDGLALDSLGQPVGGTVYLTGTGTFPYNYTLTADTEGMFRLPEILAGPFTARLRANVGGFNLYGTVSGTVEPGEMLAMEIRLQPSGTVTGLVLRPNGVTPAVGADITLRTASGTSIKLQAQTDGRFTATGVPLGDFTVRIHDTLLGGFGIVEGQSLTDDDETTDVGVVVLDDEELAVVSTDPVDGETGVAVNKTITVVFNNPLKSVNGVSVTKGSATVNLIRTLSEDYKTVTLTGTLPDDSDLSLNIGSAVTDLYEQKFQHPYSVYFRTVDLTGPKVVALSPANQSNQVDVFAPIVVTFSENLSGDLDLDGIVTLKGPGGVVIPGQTMLSALNKVTFVPVAPLSDDTTYTVTVVGATDIWGNTQSATFTSIFLTPDTVAPVLEMISPAANGFTGDATPTIRIRVAEALTGLDSSTLAMTLDGQTVSPTQLNNVEIRLTPSAALADGRHSIEAQVGDRAGNIGTLSSEFTVDATPPGAPALSGLAAEQILAGSHTFTASATDDTSGIARIDLYSDGSFFRTLAAPDFSAVLNTVNLGEGAHVITAKAVDQAGNIGPESLPVRVYVTNRTLAVTITAPAANVETASRVQVTATANKAVDAMTFTLGSQEATVTESPYSATFDLTVLPDGTQTIAVTATGVVPGEAATAVRTIIVDNTPPAPPDTGRIGAEPPVDGVSVVHGSAGAVEGRATVRIERIATGIVFPTSASGNGSFTASMPATVDDILSLVAVDAAGNASAPSLITVRTVPTVPPTAGNTSLHYEGLAVDLVGVAVGEYAPDGRTDGVFTLGLDIGEERTRMLSHIDLSDGETTRSTQTGSLPLGVAVDPGSPLLNGADGTVSFPMTSGGTLSLIAGDGGFIGEGKTYTATAVFTDGARFVASYRIIPATDRALVAHSAAVTAAPTATVVVSPEGPGEALLTIDDIRDIDGTLVPDGAKIAVSAVNMASASPIGEKYASAGGVISGGEAAANNPDFQVFTITQGKVTALYSSGVVTPAAVTGSQAIVQVQAADEAGNVLGTKAIATMDINIRAATDRALVAVTPTQLYADGADRRVRFTVVLRDEAGNLVPDGTPVLVTGAASASLTPSGSWTPTAGGRIVGGEVAAAGDKYRLFFTTDGKVEGEYSAMEVSVEGRSVKSAAIQVLAATATGAFASTSNRAIGTAMLPLTGAASMIIDITPEAIPYAFSDEAASARILIRNIRDQRAGFLPDGSHLLLTASQSASLNTTGGAWVPTAGGTILEGDESPSGTKYKALAIHQGRIVATYSVAGVTDAPAAGETKTANVQVLMSDYTGKMTTNRAVQWKPLRLLGPGNAVGFASPAAVAGDGGLHVSTVTFSPVLDVYGNVIPDGAKVIASVAASSGLTNGSSGSSWVPSVGGQILNGDPSPSGDKYKVLTVQDGKVVVEYGSQGVTAEPSQVKTANVFLIPAAGDGSYVSRYVFSVAPVQVAGLTSATWTANPGGVFGGGNRTAVTLTDFRDATGQSIPDGVMVAVSAKSCFARTAEGTCVASAGGQIIGDVTPSWDSSARVFAITNGQVVFEYSSEGVSLDNTQKTARVQVLSITPQQERIGSRGVVAVPIPILSPGDATVEFDPPDLVTDGGDHRSRVTIGSLLGSDGISPAPDGTKVGLSVASCAARDLSGGCISSAGGKLLSAGTSPGDGTVAANNTNFQIFTVAGGKVQAIYSNQGLTASVNETKAVQLAVVSASDESTLSQYSAVVGVLQLRGITSATAIGPETISRSSGETATITFTGIADAAGTPVPDGTLVVASAASCAGREGNGVCVSSVGGTITDGAESPTGTQYKVFTVQGGSVTVTYSPSGVPKGTARIQLIPADPDGNRVGNYSLIGGVWPIMVMD